MKEGKRDRERVIGREREGEIERQRGEREMGTTCARYHPNHTEWSL